MEMQRRNKHGGGFKKEDLEIIKSIYFHGL